MCKLIMLVSVIYLMTGCASMTRPQEIVLPETPIPPPELMTSPPELQTLTKSEGSPVITDIDVLGVVVENYQSCNKTSNQLINLQAWAGSIKVSK